MPIYEFHCGTCDIHLDINMSISNYCKFNKRCKKCKGSLERVFLTAPNFAIPASCTYNGVATVSGSKGETKEARVPINIIDEKPDGSCTVTRIGKKADIENE